jgi:hypothetical protein
VLAFLILLLAGHHAVTRPTLQTVPTKPGAWPVRRHPRLLHLDPYLRGDSLAAVRLAGWLRRHGRVWGIDPNGNRTADRTVWIPTGPATGCSTPGSGPARGASAAARYAAASPRPGP